jgi:BolA protein
LREAFDPQELEVSDVSEAHRGHSGFQEGGESHFEVRITAAHFSGMTRIAQHRAIHAALGRDCIDRIHALALTVRGA